MKKNSSTTADFLQRVRDALSQLKRELQLDYERANPALREIIHLVLDEEETKAWDFSPFPHLVYADLVEAHIAALNLRAVETHSHAAKPSRGLADVTMFESAFA